jgi:hypothetical protein
MEKPTPDNGIAGSGDIGLASLVCNAKKTTYPYKRFSLSYYKSIQ